MTDPWTGEGPAGGLTVSIKPTTKYDSALLVFKGSTAGQVQQNIAEFFGLDSASYTVQTPYETFVEAERHAKAIGHVARQLGGRVVTSEDPPEAVSGAPVASQGPSRADLDDLTEEQKLILAITQAESMKTLSRLWLDNKVLWLNEAVTKAALSKSEELKP